MKATDPSVTIVGAAGMLLHINGKFTLGKLK
jgi:proteasome assembly chaperone (PAC2) family protein